MATKYKDSDILMAMDYFNGYDPNVYGANGHYANGAFFNLNKTYKESDATEAAKLLKKNSAANEELLKSLWMEY